MGGDSAVTGEQSCPTCGARVRVVGETTRSYEPVEPASVLATLRARIEALDVDLLLEPQARLAAILDAVWQAHQEAHAQRLEHVDTLDDDPQRTRYAREDSLIQETAYTTLRDVARRAGVEWHGTYDKDAA